jgi:hypothetical protein
VRVWRALKCWHSIRGRRPGPRPASVTYPWGPDCDFLPHSPALQHVKNSKHTNKYEGWPEALEMEGCIPRRSIAG